MTQIGREQITQSFPEFDINREIEEGNIKRVFEAEYQGEKVALKIIPYDENKERLEGYTEREIEIMQTIDSDVLVNLLDAWKEEIEGVSAYVIVEEFINGETLKEHINAGETSPRLGIQVAYSILDVLPQFDEGNIVHRDIKPENLMVEEDGVRLLDVGVARMNEKETLTPDFNRKGPGTTAYSAPEVLQNDRDNQNVRTDLFSTGIVLFEATTGEHPFDHQGMAYRDAILEHNRKDLEGYLNDSRFEKDLDEFYKRLTEYEPADRYRKAEHATEELEEIIERRRK